MKPPSYLIILHGISDRVHWCEQDIEINIKNHVAPTFLTKDVDIVERDLKAWITLQLQLGNCITTEQKQHVKDLKQRIIAMSRLLRNLAILRSWIH